MYFTEYVPFLLFFSSIWQSWTRSLEQPYPAFSSEDPDNDLPAHWAPVSDGIQELAAQALDLSSGTGVTRRHRTRKGAY